MNATLKLPSPNVATKTHTVYLSYKGVYGPAVLPGNLLFKLMLAGYQKNQAVRKSYVRMRPVAIALNYSIENIRNDVRQKVLHEKFPIRLTSVGLAHARPNKSRQKVKDISS